MLLPRADTALQSLLISGEISRPGAIRFDAQPPERKCVSMSESSDCGRALGTQKGPVDPHPLNFAQIHAERFAWFPHGARPKNRPHTPSSRSAGGGVIFCRQSSRRPQGEFSWEMRAFRRGGRYRQSGTNSARFHRLPDRGSTPQNGVPLLVRHPRPSQNQSPQLRKPAETFNHHSPQFRPTLQRICSAAPRQTIRPINFPNVFRPSHLRVPVPQRSFIDEI